MQESPTPELIEKITKDMVLEAEKAGGNTHLNTFVSSYRKLTTLKRLRADIEETRLSLHKFLSSQDPKNYINANIQLKISNHPFKKHYILNSPEQELITYWIKKIVLDKPTINLKEIIQLWTKEIIIPTSFKHWLKYFISTKYKLKAQAEALAVLSFSFRSASMAEYIVSLRAVCRQSREDLAHSFSGRGVVIPGSVNSELTLRDCLSKIYIEQKAMAQLAIKRHKQILEGTLQSAIEELPEVAKEFPDDPLYPKPEDRMNADEEGLDEELPEELEEEEKRRE